MITELSQLVKLQLLKQSASYNYMLKKPITITES